MTALVVPPVQIDALIEDLSRPSRLRRLARATRALVRVLGGAGLLGILVWKFGRGPFVDAWHLLSWVDLLAASAMVAVTTVLSAARWRTIALGLGVPLDRRCALAAYYRSSFLNVVLPGGVLGDAHRAMCHGRSAGDVARACRAATWDRVFGKVVQMTLMLGALALVRTPLRGPASLMVAGVLVVCGVVWLVLRCTSAASTTVLTDDLRRLRDPRTVLHVTLTSAGAALAHLAIFAVAVSAVGVDASWSTLLPVGMFVMIGSSVPLSVGGWGMREGVTVWAFAAVGLAPSAGLTVSVLCGALGTAGAVPGAVLVLSDVLRTRVAGLSRVGRAAPEPEVGSVRA